MSSHKIKPNSLAPLSISQYAHLFPKSHRFHDPNPQCPEAYYNNNSLLEHRTTHLGFGKRSDFTANNVQSPPSNKYNLPSPLGKGKGRSFGCSRDASPNGSYIRQELKILPGPGQYQNGLTPRSPKSRLSQTKNVKQGKNEINPYTLGTYYVSKYRNTKYGTIDPNAQRFPEIKISPGPGDYQIKDVDKKTIGYLDSNFRGKGSRLFDREAKFTDAHWKISENPGPGRYEPTLQTS